LPTQKIEDMIRERREERGLPPREKHIKKASVVGKSLPSEGIKHQQE
jgi:hypothetical protein